MPAAVTDTSRLLRRARALRVAGLYAVTPDSNDTAGLCARVEAAIAGGAAAIQYRNKSADTPTRCGQAAALARVCTLRGTLFIVNDDPQLAAAVDADGVHLGGDDGSVIAARELLGPDRIIGVSCYNELSRAERAVAAGADYVAFGSFFASGVKPGARRADVNLLRGASSLNVPVVAIGGITAGNAGQLARAGADAVAVISAVFDAEDVQASANALAGAFAAPRVERPA